MKQKTIRDRRLAGYHQFCIGPTGQGIDQDVAGTKLTERLEHWNCNVYEFEDLGGDRFFMRDLLRDAADRENRRD